MAGAVPRTNRIPTNPSAVPNDNAKTKWTSALLVYPIRRERASDWKPHDQHADVNTDLVCMQFFNSHCVSEKTMKFPSATLLK